MIFGVVLAVVCCLGAVAVLDSSDSDAQTYNKSFDLTVGQYFEDRIPSGTGSGFSLTSGTLPPGLIESGGILKGTPTTPGTYDFTFRWVMGAPHTTNYHIVVTGVEYTITYNATMGTINGSTSWAEKIPQGAYASLPAASYSSGAQTFVGWSTSSTGTSTVTSYKPTADVTLYAVWQQNSTTISSHTATITQGQPFSYTFTTTPANASVTLQSLGGMTGLSLSGKTLSGTVNAEPGTYTITVNSNFSGYKVSTGTVKITVPIVIVEPIEYQWFTGVEWTYEPVTNPKNATISIDSVKLGSTTLTSGNNPFSMSGRSIVGTPTETGTYSITFKASANGYSTFNKTVRIIVEDMPIAVNPPTIGNLTAVPRADEPRTIDLSATNVAYADIIEFMLDGVVFASGRTTAVFEGHTAGVYIAECKATNAAGSVTKSVEIVIEDAYYHDMAWVGVPYAYVVEGTVTVSQAIPWMSSQNKTANGKTYTMVYGIPIAQGEHTYTIGSETVTVTVYPAETVAPTANFSASVNGYTATVTDLSDNASKVMYDYDDGTGWTTDITHTYTDWGYFTIRQLAINNIGDRIASFLVEVEIPDTAYISLNDLTDFDAYINQTVYLLVGMLDTDVLTISGTAAQYLGVDEDNPKLITGVFDTVGTYALTVIVTHTDSTISQKGLIITVRDSAPNPNPNPNPSPFDPDGDLIKYLVIGLIILLIIAGIIVVFKSKGKTKPKNGKPKGKAGGKKK